MLWQVYLGGVCPAQGVDPAGLGAKYSGWKCTSGQAMHHCGNYRGQGYKYQWECGGESGGCYMSIANKFSETGEEIEWSDGTRAISVKEKKKKEKDACKTCEDNGLPADKCGCGVCGSFGQCRASCSAPNSKAWMAMETAGHPLAACPKEVPSPPPHAKEKPSPGRITCNEWCKKSGYDLDACGCGVCGSFADSASDCSCPSPGSKKWKEMVADGHRLQRCPQEIHPLNLFEVDRPADIKGASSPLKLSSAATAALAMLSVGAGISVARSRRSPTLARGNHESSELLTTGLGDHSAA